MTNQKPFYTYLTKIFDKKLDINLLNSSCDPLHNMIWPGLQLKTPEPLTQISSNPNSVCPPSKTRAD